MYSFLLEIRRFVHLNFSKHNGNSAGREKSILCRKLKRRK